VLKRAGIGPDDDEEFGFAAGGGIEYAFTDRIIGKFEGLYADFSNAGSGRGNRVVGVTNTGRPVAYTAKVDDTVRFGLMRAGLNFRFDTR
jgi:outer membrane immunogenic protein